MGILEASEIRRICLPAQWSYDGCAIWPQITLMSRCHPVARQRGEVGPRINAIGWREAKGRSSSNSASEVHPRIKPRVLPISTASYRFDAFSFLNIRAMWVLTVLWLM